MRGLAAAILAALVLAPAAGARVVSLGVGSVVRYAGTSLYCSVVATTHGPAASCFRLSGGRTVPGSYGFVIGDTVVGAVVFTDATKRSRSVFSKAQPALPPVRFSGAQKQVLTLRRSDLATVGGTHIVLSASRNKLGEPVFGGVLTNPQGRPFAGAYGASVSEHRVIVARVTSDGGSKVVFTRP